MFNLKHYKDEEEQKFGNPIRQNQNSQSINQGTAGDQKQLSAFSFNTNELISDNVAFTENIDDFDDPSRKYIDVGSKSVSLLNPITQLNPYMRKIYCIGQSNFYLWYDVVENSWQK